MSWIICIGVYIYSTIADGRLRCLVCLMGGTVSRGVYVDRAVTVLRVILNGKPVVGCGVVKVWRRVHAKNRTI